MPKLRFPEFTEPWEQRKLADVLLLLKDGTHGTHNDAEFGPLLLSAKNIKNGTVQWDESDRRISKEDYNSIHSNFKPQKGDVLLTIVGSIGETAILSQPEGVTFQRSVAFLRPSDEISSEFLYSEIQGQKFQKELNDRKSTSAQPGIYLGDLGAIPIVYPISGEEQTKIGEYFANLDNLIIIHQHKVDTLKKYKRGLLTKLFPRNGETIPELRFPGFEGEWQCQKISSLAEFSKGNGYSKNDLIEAGTPIILYGRLYTKYKSTISDVDTFVEVKNGSVYSKGDEVIVPASGETADDIARASAVLTSGILLGGDLNIIHPAEYIIPSFMALYITFGEAHKELARRAQGKSIVHIHNSDIQEINISFPTRKEQDKIVNIINKLDSLIERYQSSLDILKIYKNGLLQQMFI